MNFSDVNDPFDSVNISIEKISDRPTVENSITTAYVYCECEICE